MNGEHAHATERVSRGSRSGLRHAAHRSGPQLINDRDVRGGLDVAYALLTVSTWPYAVALPAFGLLRCGARGSALSIARLGSDLGSLKCRLTLGRLLLGGLNYLRQFLL